MNSFNSKVIERQVKSGAREGYPQWYIDSHD